MRPHPPSNARRRAFAPAIPAGVLALVLLGIGCPLTFVSGGDAGGVNEPASPGPEFRPIPDGGEPAPDAGNADGGPAAPEPDAIDLDAGVDAGADSDAGAEDAGTDDAGADAGPVVEPPRCGDLAVQTSLQETCDDGNLIDGDGCNALCALEQICTGETGVAITALAVQQNVTTHTGTIDDATTQNGVVFELPTPQTDAFPWTIVAALEAPSTVLAIRLGTPGGVDNGGIGLFSLRFVDAGGTVVGAAGPFAPATETGAAETFAVPPAFDVSRIELVIESGMGTGVAFHAFATVGAARCCGDEIWDADEACEDGNNVDTDGCDAQCEIETGFNCAAARTVNLIHNGGFGGGAVGFTAEIQQVSGPLVPDDCGDQRQLLAQSTTYDADGDGFFLAVEGQVVDGAVVWSQTRELAQGTYELSVSLHDRSPEDAIRPSLEVFWGDQSQGLLVADEVDPTLTLAFQVPLSTSAELSLRNREVACPGNDIALDGVQLVRTDFEGSRCSPCGDGLRLAGEACDDGNQIDGDGCSAACDREANDIFCPIPGLGCVALGPAGSPVTTALLGGNGGGFSTLECAANELLVGWEFVRESHFFVDYVRRIAPVCAEVSVDFDGVFRPGDERTLATVGGGAFGTQFGHRCSPDRFAVGVSGTVRDDYVASLRLYCGQARVLPGGVALVDVTRSDLNGNTGGTESAPIFCPAGTIATGIQVRSGAVIDALSLRCRTLTIEPQ